MSFLPQKGTYDSYPPSSRTSMHEVLHHRSSKETIESHRDQGSVSNFSVHTSTAAIHKDLVGFSGKDPFPPVSHHSSSPSNDRVPSIPDHKYLHSLEKPKFGFGNQSVSTVRTIREPESNNTSTPTCTLRQRYRSPSRSVLEDEANLSLPSISCPSRTIAPTLITDPGPSPSPDYAAIPSPPLNDGDIEPLVTMEISTVDTSSIRPASFLPRLTDRMGNTWRSHGGAGTANAKGKKRMFGILKFNKRPEISTLLDPPHLTRVGFDSSTRKITGLSKYWKRLSQDSGISKPAQDKDLLAVMDIDKLYREGSGNVSDRMDSVPGSSRSAPIPGAAHANSGESEYEDDSLLPMPALAPPKNFHSPDDSQSDSHLPESYCPALFPLYPTKPDFKRSNSHNHCLNRRVTSSARTQPGSLAPPASAFFFLNLHCSAIFLVSNTPKYLL